MYGLLFCLLCAILSQLFMLRRYFRSIYAPTPSSGFGGFFLSFLGCIFFA